jgi:O-antigen/teichoic acid export membrane protein
VLYLRSNFSGLFLFKTDSLLSVMDKVLMIIFCAIMLWGGVLKDGFHIEHFIYAQVLAYAITAATALIILIHKTGMRRLRWDMPVSWMIIKKSLPFALLALLMSFYSRLDPVMLERMLPEGTGATQSGIYAGAFRMLDAIVMIVYLVSVPLLPVYSKMTKEGEDVSQITKLVFTLVFCASSAIAITLSFTADGVIALFYDNNTAEMTQVFKILIFCLIPISSIYVFGTLLTANGNLKLLNIIALASLVTNFVVNLIVIPRLMAHGSAFAALATQMVSAVAQVVIAIRIFHLHISARYLLQMLGFFAAVVLANIGGLSLGLPWWAVVIGAGAISIAVMFGLRLASLKELVAILRSKEE